MRYKPIQLRGLHALRQQQGGSERKSRSEQRIEIDVAVMKEKRVKPWAVYRLDEVSPVLSARFERRAAAERHAATMSRVSGCSYTACYDG